MEAPTRGNLKRGRIMAVVVGVEGSVTSREREPLRRQLTRRVLTLPELSNFFANVGSTRRSEARSAGREKLGSVQPEVDLST